MEEEDGKRDTCNELDIDNNMDMVNISIDNNQHTNNINYRPRDYEGELQKPVTIDIDFFPDFAVDGNLWDVWDKIETQGFVYIHQQSGRPLAAVKTIDRETDEMNGYCFWFQLAPGKAVAFAVPLSEKPSAKLFLDELDKKYNLLGSWLNDLVDDEDDTKNTVLNTERDDEIEHTFLYNLFLSAVGVSRVEQEKRAKIVSAKRRLNTTNNKNDDNNNGNMVEDCNK